MLLQKRLIKGFDRGRLRMLLALLFLALAVPTAALIWQAYGQLKWEAFHQYRAIAEELTDRIDARLIDMINANDARSFADYAFLVVSGDPSANFVQRSPLSAYPVAEDLPGVIGYFQVDADGRFSTPILPPAGTEASALGIGEAEYAGRRQLAREIQSILADNRLVPSRPEADALRNLAASAVELEEQITDRDEPSRPAAGSPAAASGRAGNDVAARVRAEPEEGTVAVDRSYSQRIFDQLNQSGDAGYRSDVSGKASLDDGAESAKTEEERLNRIKKVSDLNLDAALEVKSEQAERRHDLREKDAAERADTMNRMKRREQIVLPESEGWKASEPPTNLKGPSDLRITAFESEIDPLEFSLLDSGHFVLFRRVWRDGERYIQGMLVDRASFTRDIVGEQFVDTVLANMSNLIVAYEDEVIGTFKARDGLSYSNVAEGLGSTLLYRSRLAAPLSGLELIFSIQRLPAGPGGRVLGWVTLVLAIVFAGGFVTLYQLGLRQINLARQQQDFVSAVSHELKTPLTSIRMYGEMLRQGWVDEKKRQSYYEFIHDESERLSRLISNVLQLARITRSDPQFDLKSIQVGALMNGIESKISGQVARAGFELRFSAADNAGAASIRVDEDCFAQIIINLVDNAIKFSKNAADKVIEVSCERSAGNRIQMSVRDFGPGVAKDQMRKIFQLFYRSESELTRETVGTGIGLAIVHQLTMAMNGRVDLVNAEPGAEFRVSFPIAE